MDEERVEFHTTNYNGMVSKFNKGIALQTLATNIEAAKRSGILFLFAMHLKSLLKAHEKVNGPPTSVEMEMIIAKTAQAMLGR